ncbi:myelin expression factor 2-like [Mytilus edulis]|uniref:myelin expression factor 2-like n=1 Tax=Mytilus edulis TaxID=6550 RepID=UPI0039EFE1EA
MYENENDGSQSPNDNTQQEQDQEQEQRSVSRSRSRSPVRRSRSNGSRSNSRSPGRNERHRDRARRINLISKRIIISNIPYEMKWQDIKDIFRKEVGDVTYVELFENGQGKSKGQGVIEFKDKDTARKAIENMHRYKIKDRNIVVREERESDRNIIGGRGVMGSGPSGGGMGGGMIGNMGGGGGGVSPQVLSQLGIDGPVTNQVFVSNLDYKITWKKLKDVFRLAGNVTRAEIKEDKDGKSRGMGTVTFETPFEAVQAVSMFNGQSLYDRSMRVKMDAMGAADKSSSMPLPSGLKGIGAGLGPGGTPLQNQNTNMGFSGSGGMGMGGGMGGGMGNMGSSSMGGGMGNMGMDSGMGMGNMGMSNMGSGMGGGSSMGMGNMGSGNYGSSGMGMSMGSSGMGMGNMSSGMSDYGSMGGNSNYNSSGYGSSMSGGMGDGMRGMGSGMNSGSSMSAYSTGITDLGGSMGGSSGYGGGSGRSGTQSYSTSSGRSGGDRDRDGGGNRSTRPDNCTVVVKNLPWKVTWQDLKEKFRSVADVKFAEIKMENGKSQGWGLVRFGSADDAQNAISMMNRTRIDGREVDVKLYR